MEIIPDWLHRDLERWQIEKGCKEYCDLKGDMRDIKFCLQCMQGTITPELRDQQIEKYMEKVQHDIEETGWSVMYVGDIKGTSWGYSVGMWETLKHPEIIIIGLSYETTVLGINNIGMFVEKGEFFTEDDIISDIMNMPVKFKKVDKIHYDTYFKMWFNRYRHFDFNALQMLWTDRNGKFPDDKGYEKQFKFQIILN